MPHVHMSEIDRHCEEMGLGVLPVSPEEDFELAFLADEQTEMVETYSSREACSDEIDRRRDSAERLSGRKYSDFAHIAAAYLPWRDEWLPVCVVLDESPAGLDG